MASENPSWGEERIGNELLLKLGSRVSPRTVNKYRPPRPRCRPRGDLRWSTFLRLHAQGIIACDFFVAITATFRLLYVFVVIVVPEVGSFRPILQPVLCPYWIGRQHPYKDTAEQSANMQIFLSS